MNIGNRVPVNKTASLVTQCGEHFKHSKKITTIESAFPIETSKPTEHMIKDPSFVDLTGFSFGRLTVVGMYKNYGNKKLHVLKCSCGNYCVRSKKTILNKNTEHDRCAECMVVANLKRSEAYRRTGKNQDVKNF